MAENQIKWTKEQLKAIKSHDSDVLVTASAGTGKTAVLSERCVDIIRDKGRDVSVRNMLVLTFTNAAAEQMRRRIAERLNDEFLRTNDSHLRHQTILLQASDVSTIHAFCKRLITENFYKLGLDPMFRVMESDEQRLIKMEVLERTIDWAWEQGNLRQGLTELLGGRDLRNDEGFLVNIIRLSDFLDSVAGRDRWYGRAEILSQAVNPFGNDLGRKQKQIVAEKLKEISNQIRYARELYESHVPAGSWVEKCNESFLKPVSDCLGFLENNNWESCAKIILNHTKPTVRKPKDVDEPVDELIQKTIKNAVDMFAELSNLAVLNPDYLDAVGGSASLQGKVLIELVKGFNGFYCQAKGEINCLDFADLEHYALKLLSRESDDETIAPSETAIALRGRYKYIFVDEYQDINPVQQRIVDLVSSGDNVFVVGDIKQSIYGFRGAQPEIFTKRLAPASREAATGGNGLRVDLNLNFRSRKKVLDFVNAIFGRIMSSETAGINYDKSVELRPGTDEQKEHGDGPAVELNILDEAAKNDDGDSDGDNCSVVSSRQRQAAMIAERIQQIVGQDSELKVYDKQLKQHRGVEYRDIVVLLRSPSARVNDYVEILQLAGIPVSSQEAKGYFEATEIRDMISLLKVLDNPQRDIELAAVLRSPLMGITDNELAKIKLYSKNSDANFYHHVLEYCNSGEDGGLAEKLKGKLDLIGRWRTMARRESLADLIWQIYRKSDYLSFVCGLPNGNVRKSNLLKLHDRAIQFEGFASSKGLVSLRRFIEFIEKLEVSGQDWGTADTPASGENAVRIMSVHKSKGLEFEVVFLAELGSDFNKSSGGDCLADNEDGIGLSVINRDAGCKLSSLAYQVISEKKKAREAAEEMRILYVALTRAKQRLILCGCERQKKCSEVISSGISFGEKRIADFILKGCKNLLEWVLYGLSNQKKLHEVFETGLAEKAIDDNLFELNFYTESKLDEFSNNVERLRKADRPKAKADKDRAKNKKIDGWKYEFGGAVICPAKDSVTRATHRTDEFAKVDYSGAAERLPKSLYPSEVAGKDMGRLIGTATHLVIASLDLAKEVTKIGVKDTIKKLLDSNLVDAEIAGRINVDSIVRFFGSEAGRLALTKGNEVYREWPFSFALDASQYGSGEFDISGETIIIQGIIDMLIKSGDGWIVIDFKTDHITKGQCEERAKSYEQQLKLYGQAAESILGKKIVGRWLWFLTPSCAVKVS
ncbi:MAG: helicase-exonuclease AddAB subunit AddA [Planctomycetes bacterium]|nr:helicase-exonuclease AddAB subunit AddA [Planctomycetota bacterium]